MKRKLILSVCVLLIITAISNAQKREEKQINPHGWFVGVGQDVKMAFQGAHGHGGQFNLELVGGVDFENWRVSMKYEWYSSIQYRKWTMFAIDYKPKFFTRMIGLSNRWETLIGAEISTIYRYDPVPDFFNDNWSIGANAETVYWLSNSIGLGAQYNVFTAEAYDNFGNEMKNWRQDVRLNLYYKF